MRLLTSLLLFASISGTAVAATPAGPLVPDSLVWDAKVGPRNFGNLIEASGILIAGKIIGDGGLFAFNADTGKLLWSHRGEQQRGANLIEGQRVFSISEKLGVRCLAAFDLKSGRQLWSTSVDPKSGESDPILDSGRIYVNSAQSHLDAYDTATGARIYSYDYGSADPVCATGIALSGNRLFFGGGQRDGAHSPGRSLHAVDAATSKQLWHYQSHFVADYISDCFSTPAVSGDTVVVTSRSKVLALRASTGALLWSGKSEGVSGGYPKPYPLSAPVIGQGIVFAARSDAIESWSLADGRPLPALPAFLGNEELVHLYVDGATLFFLGDLASDTGKLGHYPLHAMEIPSGKILWTHRVNRDIRYAESWPTNEIFITPDAVYYDNFSLVAKIAR
ncbi:MAG: PQQ-binding-like beta-propeller repeat protein [Terracidiphilus sp.]|nr:PQQ-binding-like beta-propeller repeat protein [Terracidiphilus sp.]